MIKFPSFIKLEKNKRFEYKPRFYDPIKEDIEKRTEIIRGRLNDEYVPGSHISFRRPAHKSARKADIRRTMLIALIAVLLGGVFAGYFYYGNIALYITSALVISFYIYKRFIKP